MPVWSGKTERPCVRLLREDGTDAGIAFHGVPGVHEFTSFVMGLYNAAGPGQAMEPELHQRVLAIDRDIRLQVLVSLSCTMCPDLVMAAPRRAESPCAGGGVRPEPFPRSAGYLSGDERALPCDGRKPCVL